MAFPSTLSTFNRPSATDRLNSPSHSALHNTVSSALGQVEAVIGIEGASSVVGTLMSLVKSPVSDGGGHVQTAVKGGTGQTTYTKGDFLVATNSSTLSKLAGGLDNQILTANSSTASGLNWVNATNNKIATSASVITVLNTSETSVMSTTVSGSTLGTNNAIRTVLYIPSWNPDQGVSVLTAVHYGGQRVASVMLTARTTDNNSSIVGTFIHTMIANGAVNQQRHFLEVDVSDRSDQSGQNTNIVFSPTLVNSASIVQIKTMVTGISSINSSANQTYGMTVKMTGTVARDLSTGGYTVEKIN